MNNEIKQGDKVRVSKDAPEMYIYPDSPGDRDCECIVKDTDGDNAYIEPKELGYFPFTSIIPTKYLVKVDAEAFRLADVVSDAGLHQDNYLNEDKKEPKFKVGDKVIFIPTGKVKVVSRINTNSQYAITEPNGQSPLCVRETELAPYIEPNVPKFKVGDRVRNVKSDLCGIALNIEHGIVEVGIPYDKERHYWNTDIVELVQPTEQTESEKKPNVGSIKIPVEIDLTESYWDAYAADLAKEIVLKTVNSASDKRPSVIAEYATDVAKAVVEGLKRK